MRKKKVIPHSLHVNPSPLLTPSGGAGRHQGKTAARFIKVRRGVFSERGHRDLQTEEAENETPNQSRRGKHLESTGEFKSVKPVLLLHNLSLTFSVSCEKNSMISSSCCSTMVSHCGRGDKRVFLTTQITKHAAKAFGFLQSLTANFKLAETLESKEASERSMASPLRDFTLM